MTGMPFLCPNVVYQGRLVSRANAIKRKGGGDVARDHTVIACCRI